MCRETQSHLFSHLFAENSRWTAASSVSVLPVRYESIMRPMAVNLSGKRQSSASTCRDQVNRVLQLPSTQGIPAKP